MYCRCGAQNLPTDLRCLRCGASLVGDPVGGSEIYRKNAREIDSRMYGGIGGFFGFTLTVLLCKTVFSSMYLSDRQIYGSAVFVAVALSALGGYIARRRL